MPIGVKHLVECHCILPQFRDKVDPVYHRFVVFSIVDDDDNVVPKYTLCNNCGVVHHVVDLMKSAISMGNDNDASVVSIDDIKLTMPDNIRHVLETYSVSLPGWEEAAFILEQQNWGSTVILTADREGNPDGTAGKLMRISGPSAVKIEPYVIRDIIG